MHPPQNVFFDKIPACHWVPVSAQSSYLNPNCQSLPSTFRRRELCNGCYKIVICLLLVPWLDLPRSWFPNHNDNCHWAPQASQVRASSKVLWMDAINQASSMLKALVESCTFHLLKAKHTHDRDTTERRCNMCLRIDDSFNHFSLFRRVCSWHGPDSHKIDCNVQGPVRPGQVRSVVATLYQQHASSEKECLEDQPVHVATSANGPFCTVPMRQ